MDKVLNDIRERVMGINGGKAAPPPPYTQCVQRPCGRGCQCAVAPSLRLVWLEEG